MAEDNNAMAEPRPTATEFIPASESGVRDDSPAEKRTLAPTGDKGVEIVGQWPTDDEIVNRIYICDECGHSESTESGMGLHLWEHQQEGDDE